MNWESVLKGVSDWLAVVNYTFDNAIKMLSVSPFDSNIRIIDTAMAAVATSIYPQLALKKYNA